MAAAERPEELMFVGSRTRVLSEGPAVGLVDLIEMPPGDRPPLHVHHEQDEGFYVVDGEFTLFLPGEERTLGPGDFLLAPRGTPHAYLVGDRPAHVIVMSIPAGFEQFVIEVTGLGRDPSPEELTEIAAGHGIEILGPPGALP